MVHQTHVRRAVHRAQIQRTDLLRGASLPFSRRGAQSQLLGGFYVAPVVLPAVVFVRDDPAGRIRSGTNLSDMSGAIVVPSMFLPTHELDAHRFTRRLR